MKKPFISLFLLILVVVGAILPAKAQPNLDKLPFKMTFTPLPFENQPDYFGGGEGNAWCSDFPYSPVKIDNEYWLIYKSGDGPAVYRWKGTNIENCKRQPDGFASFPTRRPYMLGGMWYDKTTRKLYAPMHCEYIEEGGGNHRQISLASSTDKGLTWKFEGMIVTRDVLGGRSLKQSEYSGIHWDGGAGDFFIYADEPGGYIYLYAGTYIQPKRGTYWQEFIRHYVARCAIKDIGNPSAWKKFYNGKWNEPGLGGKASYVNAYYVMYNTYLKKYIGLNYGNGLALCTDLEKQDWSPIFKIPGNYWGAGNEQAWHVTDTNKANIFSGGQTLYLYSYWDATNKPVAHLYKIDLSAGETPNTGYSLEGYLRTSIASTDPTLIYPLEPLYESLNPIESRQTRRVHCTHAETVYSGKWDSEEYDAYAEKTVKSSVSAKNTIEFSFKGADIYWRAVKGPDCGLADVFIDGAFQKTVDCWSDPKTAEQIAFLKTGLDSKAVHNIKVVVRGEKNLMSKGLKISHLMFEYSADSYRASDGFSSIQGKNGWYYQQKKATSYIDMVFEDIKWVGDQCENYQYRNEMGYSNMLAVTSDVARKWVAPHAGTVRVEGNISFYQNFLFQVGDAVETILLNDKEVWSGKMMKWKDKQSHDITLKINKGDALYFVLKGDCQANSLNVTWDPVITYVDNN